MSRPEREEGVLSRWSRLKREAAKSETAKGEATREEAESSDAAAQPAADRHSAGAGMTEEQRQAPPPLPELPPLEELTPESDFEVFMDPRVDDDMRRAALRVLFGSSDFNVSDGLDVYAEDYTKLEKLTPAFVAGLRFVRQNVLGAETGAVVEQPNAAGVNSTATSEDMNGLVDAGAEPPGLDTANGVSADEDDSGNDQAGNDQTVADKTNQRAASEDARQEASRRVSSAAAGDAPQSASLLSGEG